MTQQGFWPPVPHLPAQGLTPVALAASQSGAKVAAGTVKRKTMRILAALRSGPKSRQELAGATGIPINAICSCLDNLVHHGRVVTAGPECVQVVIWPRGKQTTRERFMLRCNANPVTVTDCV